MRPTALTVVTTLRKVTTRSLYNVNNSKIIILPQSLRPLSSLSACTLSTTPSHTHPSTTLRLSLPQTRHFSTTITTSSTEAPLPTHFPKFTNTQQFLDWYVLDPPTYQKFSQAWWLSNTWLMLMYAVTGSTALQMVRGVLSLVGIRDVSLLRGPPEQRVLYFLLMTPCYSLLTLLFGRVFGRAQYSQRMVRRIWGRFIPSLREKK